MASHLAPAELAPKKAGLPLSPAKLAACFFVFLPPQEVGFHPSSRRVDLMGSWPPPSWLQPTVRGGGCFSSLDSGLPACQIDARAASEAERIPRRRAQARRPCLLSPLCGGFEPSGWRRVNPTHGFCSRMLNDDRCFLLVPSFPTVCVCPS